MPRFAEFDSQSDSDAPERPPAPVNDRSRRADRHASRTSSQPHPSPAIPPHNAPDSSDPEAPSSLPNPPPKAPRIPARRRLVASKKASSGLAPQPRPQALQSNSPPLASTSSSHPHFYAHPKRSKTAPKTRHPLKDPRRKTTKRPAVQSDDDDEPGPSTRRPRLQPGSVLSIEASSAAQAAVLAAHYHSSSTLVAYAGYLRRGESFRQDCIKADRLAGIHPPHVDHLEDALEVLSHRTVKWIIRFLVHQHDVNQSQYGVIEGTRAAFKNYYKSVWNVKGDFTYDRTTGAHTGGNPCDDIQLNLLVDSYRKKQARLLGGKSRQALPMTFESMNHIEAYYDNLEPTEENELLRLYMMALLSLGFQTWTRIQEEMWLKLSDFHFYQLTDKGKTPFFSVTLIFRKTNQDDPSKKFVYEIHPEQEDDKHGIDAYKHVMAYYEKRRKWTGCNEHPDHFFFPQIVGAKMRVGEETSATEISRKLDDVVYSTPELKDRVERLGGRMTMHCLRRGGAQYRFNFATERWSINVCQWWGAWAKGEKVGTLMRYLLDDHARMANEFSDMLSPERNDRRQLLQASQDAQTAPTNADLTKALFLSTAVVRTENTKNLEALEHRWEVRERASEKRNKEHFEGLRRHMVDLHSSPSRSSHLSHTN
ncbi:hypothetical protein P7C70_g3228, partial [Phenoliferia sp. Uapishka_3]